jgi:hypothetical protein
VHLERGKPTLLRGIMIDVQEWKRADLAAN